MSVFVAARWVLAMTVLELPSYLSPPTDDEVWYAAQHYDEIERGCFRRAMLDSFGEERLPSGEMEAEDFEARLDSLRDRMSIFRYQPHFKQRVFHNSRALIKAFFGSNQSGKTTALLAECISWGLGFRPWDKKRVLRPDGTRVAPPVKLLLGGEDYVNAVAGNLWPKFGELLPWEVVVRSQDKMSGSIIHRADLYTGSFVKALSYELDATKWEGYTWHWAGFDEPPPRHSYIATARGAMKHRAPMCYSMTPVPGTPLWIYEEIASDPKALVIDSVPRDEQDEREILEMVEASPPERPLVVYVTLDENPFLEDDQKEILAEKVRKRPEEAASRLTGRFSHMLGRVYPTFEQVHHVLQGEFEWDPSWPAGVVVDPHDRRPYAIAWFVVTPRNEIVWIAEWPDFDFFETRQWSWGPEDYASYFASTVMELGLSRMTWWLMDPRFGHTPKASAPGKKTLIEVFEDYGIYFDREFWSEEIAAGRGLVHEALSEDRMFWLPECANFIRAMFSHTWQDYRGRDKDERAFKEREGDRFKDWCDLARYAALARPEWIDPGSVYIERQVPPNMGMG